MKRRISAILLALGLSVSALSMGVYAAETETEAVTEAVTEAESAAAKESLEEEESELAEVAEEAEEAAETETAETQSQEDQLKSYLSSTLSQISAWSDSDIEMIIDGDDASSAAIASNWKSVKEELGAFEEVLSAELSADGTAITGHVKYEKASDSTDVVVTYSVNQSAGTFNVEWEVDYPMGVLMQRAALNTVMGIGIVFITLLFLSWLIGKLHIIPDTIEKMQKKNAPAPTPAPAPVAAPAPVVEEEDLTDDLELVAVITAAIAASENTSSDGFVVRSIKKANKRNWQRA
jgi:sodium pump decarboxylase gamma subunit